VQDNEENGSESESESEETETDAEDEEKGPAVELQSAILPDLVKIVAPDENYRAIEVPPADF